MPNVPEHQECARKVEQSRDSLIVMSWRSDFNVCDVFGFNGSCLFCFLQIKKTEEYDGARDHKSLKSYVMKHRPIYGMDNGDMEEEYTDDGIPVRFSYYAFIVSVIVMYIFMTLLLSSLSS